MKVFNFHKGSERILPNLVGQTEESAKAQLAELDAEPSITYENSSEPHWRWRATAGRYTSTTYSRRRLPRQSRRRPADLPSAPT